MNSCGNACSRATTKLRQPLHEQRSERPCAARTYESKVAWRSQVNSQSPIDATKSPRYGRRRTSAMGRKPSNLGFFHNHTGSCQSHHTGCGERNHLGDLWFVATFLFQLVYGHIQGEILAEQRTVRGANGLYLIGFKTVPFQSNLIDASHD